MKYKALGLFLFLTVIISGCTDKLGTIDLSGQIDLERDSGGWAYRELVSSRIRPHRVDPEERLGDYQKDLELQKAVAIGKGEYMITTKFKTDKPSTGHEILDLLLKTDKFTVYGDYQILIYNLDQKERVETVNAKDSETGDRWDKMIGDPKSAFKKRNLERRGAFIRYFREPSTQSDCVVDILYEIKSEATRQVDMDDKFVLENNKYKYNELSVSGSARINIGFRQCLAGRKAVGDQMIRFYVLDWDLDGEFTEKDVVWSDYTNKTYQFGRTVRLTDSWSAKKDNKYRLKLSKPKTEKDKYRLEIELVGKGKR